MASVKSVFVWIGKAQPGTYQAASLPLFSRIPADKGDLHPLFSRAFFMLPSIRELFSPAKKSGLILCRQKGKK